MVKCPYCKSVTYEKQTTCPSCGAPLPEQKNIREDKISTIYNNTNISTPRKNDSNGIKIFISLMVTGLFFWFISMFSYYSTSNIPEVNTTQNDDIIQPTSENGFKYGEEDLEKYDEYNEIFLQDNANKEAVYFLTWYYIYNEEAVKAYEVMDLFIAQEVRDDGEFYIDLAKLYIKFELYGIAHYVLYHGYELTNLESVQQYYTSVPIEKVYQNTPTGDILKAMFGKSLSLITYEDLRKIKAIETDRYGEMLLYSMESLELKDGYIENYGEYRNEMKSISFSERIDGTVDFKLFVELQSMIDVTSRSITKDDLPYLKNIYYLEIYPYDDIEKLEVISKLKGLSLRGSGIKAIGNIEKLEDLEHLRLSDTEVFDISSISKLKNIKTLSIEDNENLTNLDAIYEMSSLKSLEIIEMEIMTVSINTDVVFLEKLKIQDTTIRSVDFISNFTELTELIIDDNDDLIGIPNLDNLTKLENLVVLDNYSLSSMPSLGNLPSLETLKVQPVDVGNFNKSIEFLRGANSVKKLTMSGNLATSSVSAIGSLTQLEELHLYGGVLPDSISSLSSLTNLEKLTLSGSPMTYKVNLSFLSSLKNLKYLDISDAEYAIGSEVFNLENLEVLYISNIAGNFYNISKLSKLEELYISNIKITDNIYVQTDGFMASIGNSGYHELSNYLNEISKLSNLRVLSIGSNKVDSVEFARNLSNLEELYMSDNYVSDLEPLSQLENLKYINVVENPISNWGNLKQKENLEIVNIK